ncbi:MAG: helix-turn-helix transcriptional regulator, partial [Lentisphaeria bacterium]|nr:helix-turn-helix transcriptional regulator [Lentisphaeria bacterium]
MDNAALIDRAKAKVGNMSELARRVGVTREFLYRVRNEKTPMTVDLAADLAQICGENEAVVTFEVLASRSTDDSHKSRWLKLAKAASVLAIFAAIIPGVSLYSSTSYADDLSHKDIHYAHRRL